MSNDTAFIPCQRELFEIPDDIAYFNCAYLSPLMRPVKAAGEAGISVKAAPWKVMPSDFFVEADRARAQFAGLIGAKPEEIAILPSVSYGIGTAANNLPLDSGKRIIVLKEQFPSNVYPWRALAAVRGGAVHTVARQEDESWTDSLLREIDERTGIVAIPNCHWADGSLVDLKVVGARCGEMGVPLVLDVTQSLGVVPLDVAVVGPAFLVCAAYKWLLGPYNLAFMYVNPHYHDGVPLEHNWITRLGSEDFSGLVNYSDALIPDAQRFDMGERGNFVTLPMAIASITQLNTWGIENIAATLAAYNDELVARVEPLGFHAVQRPFRSGHLIGLRHKSGLPDDLGERLTREGVYLSRRGDAIRVAPHLYNNRSDMDRLVSVLKSAV